MMSASYYSSKNINEQMHIIGETVNKIIFIEGCSKFMTQLRHLSIIYTTSKLKPIKRHLAREEDQNLPPAVIHELNNGRIAFAHNGRLSFNDKLEQYYGIILIWNIYTGFTENLFKNAFEGQPADILRFADLGNSQLVTIDYYGKLALWDLTLEDATGPIKSLVKTELEWSLALCPVSDKIVACSTGVSLALIDVDCNFKQIGKLGSHNALVKEIVKVKDNDLLISVAESGQIKVWNWKTCVCLKTILANAKIFSSVTLPRQYPVLVTSGFDKTIKFWNLDNGKCIKSLKTPKQLIYKLQLSNTGSIFGYLVKNFRVGICVYFVF
jgi:WD40 repeat protein